jgi:hypothetical protein
MKTVMAHHPHIESVGMADTFSARVHRSFGIVCRRVQQDVRCRFIMWRPSGESVAVSFPREHDGAGEREVRSRSVMRRPSGESRRSPFRESETESVSERCGVLRRHRARSARAVRHPRTAATFSSLSPASVRDLLRHNKA